MLKRSILLATSLAALLAGTTAIAQTPTNEELDLRMRAMESTMQTMLELLQAQQGAVATTAGATTTAAEETPAPAPAGYQMGGLYLDVFTRTFSKDAYGDMYFDPSKLPDGPNGVPVGSVLIKSPDTYRWGAFVKEAALAGFKDADALVGVQWSGVLEVLKAGPHTISIQLKKGNKSVGSCRAVLRLSSKIVADAKGTYKGNNDEQIDVAQSTQELTPGLYDFSIWTTCVGDRDNSLEVVSTDLRMAAPGDRAPKPIALERFGVQP